MKHSYPFVRRHAAIPALALLLVTACGDTAVDATDTACCGTNGLNEGGAGLVEIPGEPADLVISAPGDTGDGVTDSMRAIDGVRGGGLTRGGTNTFSLGFAVGEDNTLTLSWSERTVIDGPGVDFVVFENAFRAGSGSSSFMDLVVVMVSENGEDWAVFPHDYTNEDELEYSSDRGHWPGFAGVNHVSLNVESNRVDPFDHEAAGGDPFDLDDLPRDDVIAEGVRANGFRFLRLQTAPSLPNPDTGEPFVHDPISNGADIDGVYARYFHVEE